MSTVGILSQIPGITKMPVHQVCILDATLEGRHYGNEQDIVLPVAKDDLVRIRIKFKVDWDTGKDASDDINQFIETVLGRKIFLHEPVRRIPLKDRFEIGVMFYYLKGTGTERKLIPVDSWVYCQAHKQAVEDFTRLAFGGQKWRN